MGCYQQRFVTALCGTPETVQLCCQKWRGKQDEHADGKQPALAKIKVGGQSLPRGAEDQAAKRDFKGQHEHEPEEADAEQLAIGGSSQPGDGQPGDEQDDRGAGEDSNLAGAMVAHATIQQGDPQNAMQDLGDGDEHPDDKGFDNHVVPQRINGSAQIP